MCLSTVYKNEIDDANAIMHNVMLVELDGEDVILTDLLGRRTAVKGTLRKASLTDGYVIIKAD